MKLHKINILLKLALVLTSTISARAVTAENNHSQNTTPVFRDPREPVPTVEEPIPELNYGMMIEDLICLQCLFDGISTEPAADFFSDEVTVSYLRYLVANRKNREQIADYLDLCEMSKNSVDYFDSNHFGLHDYIVRKAHADLKAQAENTIASRSALVKISSEEVIQALDDKHCWTPVEDKKLIESDPPIVRKAWREDESLLYRTPINLFRVYFPTLKDRSR
jgi:hypothetical protein